MWGENAGGRHLHATAADRRKGRQRGLTKKDVIFCERSHYVYENARNSGIMPDEKSGIYVDSTPILQKFTAFDGHFRLNSAFAMAFLRSFLAMVH
jgi:hypothetical protein